MFQYSQRTNTHKMFYCYMSEYKIMDTTTRSTQFSDVPNPLRNDTSTCNAWQDIKYVFYNW